MTNQIQELKDFIKSRHYATYDEVKTKANEINDLWREGTWNRGLRPSRSPMIETIYKSKPEESPIVGYKYKIFEELRQTEKQTQALLFEKPKYINGIRI